MASQVALPAIRQDLDLFPGPRTPQGSPTWTLHDPVRNRFFHIGWLEFEMLKRWGGQAQDVVKRINGETPLRAGVEQVEAILAFFKQNQLVRDPAPGAGERFYRQWDGRRRQVWKSVIHNYLFFRVPLVRPDGFLAATLPFLRFVYTSFFAWLVAIAGITGLVLVLRQWDSFISTFPYLFSWEGLTLFGLAILFTKTVHELGHAYTAKYYGLKVPTMGVAFLVMWPVLYTDTTESWKLTSFRSRMAIGAAGVIAELGLAALATLLWNFLPDGPMRSAVFFVAAVSWIITLAINVNPFMRWDGYYLLADFLRIQNLQDRAFSFCRWRLREWLFDFGDPSPESFTGRTRRIVLLYGFGTWIYRFFLFLGIAVIVYFFFFKLAGIILAAVELGWFIGRPIYKEVERWGQRRGDLRWNRATVRTLLFLSGLVALLFVPWRSYVEAPAVMRPHQHTRLFAQVPAQITTVHVRTGQKVERGELLFSLSSPDLDYQIRQSERRIAMLQSDLSRRSTAEYTLEQRGVLEQQLATALAERSGLNAQLRELTVTAPFGGEIHNIPDDLRSSRWIGANQPLGLLVDRSRTMVLAYFAEHDVDRISGDVPGTFYPQNTEAGAVPVLVTEIDRTSADALDEPYSASVYGGGVAVTVKDNELRTHNAVYRVRLAPREQPGPLARVLRGSVRLPAESQSIMERVWLFVSAIVIRESGF